MSDPQIQIPLAGGPDESADPRQLPPGSVISVRNAVYDQDGSYQPRLGYTAMNGTSTNPAGIRRLYTFGTELLANDGASLWTFDDQASNWVNRDSLPPFQASYGALANSSSAYLQWDNAVYQDYRVVAWIDQADNLARVAVYAISTGATVLAPTVLSASTTYFHLSVGVVGSTAVIVLSGRSAAQIDGYTLSLFPVGSPSSATRLDNSDVVAAGSPFAAAYMTSTFAIAYEHSVSGSQSAVALRSFNSSRVLQASTTFSLTSGTHGFAGLAARGTAGENLWVAVNSTTTAYSSNIVVVRADPSTLVVSAGAFAMTPSTVTTHSPGSGLQAHFTMGIERVSSSTCLVAACGFNGTLGQPSFASTNWATFTTAGQQSVTSGAANCMLATAPAYDSALGACVAIAYVPASALSVPGKEMVAGVSTLVHTVASVPGSYAIVSLPVSNSTAVSLDHLGTVAPQIAQQPMSLSSLPNISKLVATSTGYDAVIAINRLSTRTGLFSLTLARAEAARLGAAVGRELYIGGTYYDRVRAVENGFIHAPMFLYSGIGLALTDNSGAPTNTFQYVLTYARVDAAGNLEESAPSFAALITSSATPNVTMTVSPIHITRKQREPADTTAPGTASRVYILVYRTQALENGDNTLHLVTAVPYPAANANTLTTDQVTITDSGVSDVTLSTAPVLYTVSGELQHDAPEQLHGVISHFNRAWGIGADNRTVWFSQEYSDGVLPAWSLSGTISIDDANEPLTALASLYDKLLIFTARRIYVIYGDGPSPAGTGAEWSLPPQRLPAVSGCIDPRSIVFTPLGIMFQSERGIELVGPDLTASFIGQPVSVTTATYPVCASATMASNSSTVRFCFTNSDTLASQNGGVIVLYDFRRNRWSVHVLTAGLTGAPSYASTYHPTYGFIEGHNLDEFGTPNAAVISRENTLSDPAPWADYGTNFVPLQVQLAWIKSGDLQGWQRVRRIRVLADYHDAHGLSATLDYDYQTVGETHTYSAATISGFVNGSWEQVRIIPAQGKSEAIRLTLATTAPASVGTGRGAGFIGVAFEIRAKQGGYRKLSTAQRT